MKKTYLAPELSLTPLASSDVITMSNPFMELADYGEDGGMTINAGDFWN